MAERFVALVIGCSLEKPVERQPERMYKLTVFVHNRHIVVRAVVPALTILNHAEA